MVWNEANQISVSYRGRGARFDTLGMAEPGGQPETPVAAQLLPLELVDRCVSSVRVVNAALLFDTVGGLMMA